MTQRKTPPLGLVGEYTLRAPFSARQGVKYTCQAIRSFRDLIYQEKNVFEVFYERKGISYEDYKTDVENNVAIVTLQSNEETIYVPDSYIETLPYQGSEKMSLVALSADLGPLPDELSLDFVATAFSQYCSDVLGYTPEIKIHRLPHTDSLTQPEIDNIEAIRQASLTIRKDLWARAKELETQNQRLHQKLDRAYQILKDNGLVQPAGP